MRLEGNQGDCIQNETLWRDRSKNHKKAIEDFNQALLILQKYDNRHEMTILCVLLGGDLDSLYINIEVLSNLLHTHPCS